MLTKAQIREIKDNIEAEIDLIDHYSAIKAEIEAYYPTFRPGKLRTNEHYKEASDRKLVCERNFANLSEKLGDEYNRRLTTGEDVTDLTFLGLSQL